MKQSQHISSSQVSQYIANSWEGCTSHAVELDFRVCSYRSRSRLMWNTLGKAVTSSVWVENVLRHSGHEKLVPTALLTKPLMQEKQ